MTRLKYNDLDIENWKDCNIDTDSLWLIKERDKSGKHQNIYHADITQRQLSLVFPMCSSYYFIKSRLNNPFNEKN